MAGMLPGVEVARRRRLHQSGGGWLDCPNASSSGQYCSTRSRSYESHLNSSSTSFMQRSPISHLYFDQKLNDAAREAKERLDGRLRAQWKPETKRSYSGQPRSGQSENRPTEIREMETEVSGLKRSGSKMFSWPKLSWKSSEQDECSVCLEQFKAGENLMRLPCGHRFHSRCLVPWLENNAYCPCCRMECYV
ncbi:hypothetical protein ACH5RR_004413 [Cinchona calisaya]|uniref:RING-type domain-containing protein n=1 Tax=Cinchona calisaya TaxID=153742 RepID=A0ABD3AXI9_9GENT